MFLRVILIIFMMIPVSAFSAESNDPDFEQWLDELKQEAKEKGISPETIALALKDIQYKERVIASDRSQAEFKESYSDYVSKRVSEWRVKQGAEYVREHGAKIDAVTSQYGVPARFVVAIIGIETNYGTFKLGHSLFDVLATLAYDPRRGARFRKEIFAALTMIDKGYATGEQLKSSWAGALGVPQFMPSTYLDFAVDHDSDGRRDIWTHGPDLYASVANYLKRYGWKGNEAWARQVIVPASKQSILSEKKENLTPLPKVCERYNKHLFGWRNLDAWHKEGLTRMNATRLPSVDMPAAFLLTNPDLSHGFLVYSNFCTLMRYNPSFKYALSVGVLSDKLKLAFKGL